MSRKQKDAAVAQSVVRRIGSAEVTGPIPVSSFLKKLGFKPFFDHVIIMDSMFWSPFFMQIPIFSQYFPLVYFPHTLRPIIFAFPTCPFIRTIWCWIKVIPVTAAVFRIAHAAIPTVPTGAGIAITIEQIIMMI